MYYIFFFFFFQDQEELRFEKIKYTHAEYSNEVAAVKVI